MTDNSPKQKSPEPPAPIEKVTVEPKVDEPKQATPPATPGEAKPAVVEDKTLIVATNQAEAKNDAPAAPATPSIPPVASVPAANTPAPDSTASSADDTKIRRPAPKVEQPKPETPKPVSDDVEEQVAEVDNPYILSGEVDRARLVAQARMFRTYIENNAKRIAGENVTRILDVGCGEGQLTQVFAKLYPQAHIIGLDRDEKAVETARRAARNLPNVEFIVGDATQALPPGPFDLIYESMCFVHIPENQKIIDNAYQALAPGGLIWSKEMDEKVGTAVNQPGYIEIWKTLQTAMSKVGNDIFMSKGLPERFKNAGFIDVHVEEELLPMGNVGMEGRIMMAIGLGVMYNARKMISKFTQVPESDLENLYRNTVQALMAPNAPTGQVPFANTIARRPETAAPQENQAPLPDVENPYVLSGEVDRARLVAQTRLFRNYIERNAKSFLGGDIKSILDMGCGEGQLTLVFAKLYPQAKIIGIDKDEKAIEVAQRAAKGIPNVEFRVGDILQGLPEGPFDLVYESLVLMHIPGTAKIIKSVYDVLKPGGHLWTKDLHPNMETAVAHPAFARLSIWMGKTMDRIGAPWRIGGELPPILTNSGFKIVKTDEEVYTLGNRSAEERITMSINLGALYNARKLMTRVLQVPEIEMENAYKELAAAMMAPNGPRGNFVYMNVISERPAADS